MLKMKLIARVMLIVLTTALIGGLTGAWFTDADTPGTTTFTAGTLSVDVSDEFTNLPTLNILNNMAPGDVTAPIRIEIKNDGTKDLAWFGDWYFTPQDPAKDALLDKIYIKTMKMEFLKADGTKWDAVDQWYSGYNFIENGRGKDLGFNSGEAVAFNIIADKSDDDVITLRHWMSNNGSMLPGTIYENMGALKPSYKYVLTVEFAFLENAGNEYQAGKPYISPININFDVKATQVNASALNVLNPLYPNLGGTDTMIWLNAQLGKQQ